MRHRQKWNLLFLDNKIFISGLGFGGGASNPTLVANDLQVEVATVPTDLEVEVATVPTTLEVLTP